MSVATLPTKKEKMLEPSSVIKSAWYQEYESKINEKFKELQTSNNKLESQAFELNEQYRASQKFLETRAAENTQITTQCIGSGYQVERLREQNDEYIIKYRELEIQKNQQINNLEGQIRVLHDEVIALDRKFPNPEKISREQREQFAKIQDLEKKVKNKDEEIEVMSIKLSNFDKGSDRVLHSKQLENMDSQITQLMEIIRLKDQEVFQTQIKVQNFLDSADYHTGDKEKEQAAYYQQIYEALLKQQTDKFLATINEQDKQIEGAVNKKQQLENRLNSLDHNHTDIKAQSEQYLKEIVHWQKKYDQVRNNVEQGMKEKEEGLKLQNEVNQVIQGVRNEEKNKQDTMEKQLSEQLKAYQQEKEAVILQLKQKDEEFKKAEALEKQLQSQINEQKKQAQEHADRKIQIQNLRAQVQILKQQNQELYPTVAQSKQLPVESKNLQLNSAFDSKQSQSRPQTQSLYPNQYQYQGTTQLQERPQYQSVYPSVYQVQSQTQELPYQSSQNQYFDPQSALGQAKLVQSQNQQIYPNEIEEQPKYQRHFNRSSNQYLSPPQERPSGQASIQSVYPNQFEERNSALIQNNYPSFQTPLPQKKLPLSASELLQNRLTKENPNQFLNTYQEK